MIETANLLLENELLKKENEQIKSQVAFLKYQLEDLRRKIFGIKSERYVSLNTSGQLSLLDVPVEESTPPVQTVKVEEHERQQKKEKANSFQ